MASISISPKVYRRISLATVYGMALAIASGAAVRLTQSGLGCPDWPTCSATHYTAAWSFHPMVEFSNRMLTIFLGIVVGVAVVASFYRSPRRKDLTLLSFGLVGGFVAEAILGGITVLFKLMPELVMAHLLLSMAILFNALLLYHRASTPDVAPRPVVGRSLIILSRLILVVVAGVIFLGTVVTGSGPHSGSPIAKRLPIPLQSAAFLHADVVMFLIGLTLAALFGFHQANAPEEVQHKGRVLLWTMAAQAVIGYTQYFTHLPVLLVEMHVIGATLIWIFVVRLNFSLYTRPEPEYGLEKSSSDIIGKNSLDGQSVLTTTNSTK